MLQRQLLVYVGVGLLTAVLDVGTLQGLLLLGWSTTAAVTIAFLLALAFNYVCHQRYTFAAVHSLPVLLRFLALVGFNYLLTLGCVWLGERLLASVLIGKLVSMPLVTLTGFLLGKYWVFPPASTTR